jgi:hypothetical protein
MKKLMATSTRCVPVDTPLWIDDGNRVCAAAVAKVLSGRSNLALPLVIVGAAGTGKTRHLIELANGMRRQSKSVDMDRVPNWSHRLRAAIQTKTVDALVQDVLAVDLWILDEFHRANSAPKTLQFIVQRVLDRVSLGRPVAIATRHQPDDIHHVGRRALSMLKGGFITFLSPPGAEVKRQFLASYTKGAMSNPEIERVCQRATGGLGPLRALADAWMSGRMRPAAPAAPVTLQELMHRCARECGVDVRDLLGRRRTVAVHDGRKLFVVAATTLGYSVQDIAGFLDGRSVLAVSRMLDAIHKVPIAGQRALLDRILSNGGHGPSRGAGPI